MTNASKKIARKNARKRSPPASIREKKEERCRRTKDGGKPKTVQVLSSKVVYSGPGLPA